MMVKSRFLSLFILLLGFGAGFLVYYTEKSKSEYKFKLGLDLAGGTQLIYSADTSKVPRGEEENAMSALRAVIERRVNLFGVSEPTVAVEHSSALSEVREQRLIVELPGVTDIEQAVSLIGQTPLLEFKLARDPSELPQGASSTTPLNVNDLFIDTGLTGRFLKQAQLEFDNSSQFGLREPYISLEFNSEGGELFSEITGNNVGKVLAIFLDGSPISTPVIRDKIESGKAVITGSFGAEEARALARDLNFGALPVPIELVSTQSIGASLGRSALDAGMKAGVVGLTIVALFMIAWYGANGAVAVFALAIYVLAMFVLFKIIPVTLTAAGITGFILSIGMAVDANVLIFERIKEELKQGKKGADAIGDGFSRAWNSIRDANISSIITALILFWVGTSLVKGFALTFGIGVIVSMLTAVSVSRTFLLAMQK
jgi:preprotein translocase subunit SecD